jgi:CRP-like cAMP-binding protein
MLVPVRQTAIRGELRGRTISSPIPSPSRNQLLAALSQAEYDRTTPGLRLVQMTPGKVLFESGDRINHVYFPVDCIVSLLCVLKNGASAGISMVGNDGMAGIGVFLGGDTAPHRAVVQSAGHACSLPSAQLKEAFHDSGGMQLLLLKYTQSLITQMAQTAVCNRHHSIDQQLCRWLLFSLDRIDRNELQMTHELIASMLGVRREGVSEAAGKLQDAGAIRCGRGRVTVLDRGKLEALSCECYAVVRKEAERLRTAPRRQPTG